MGQSTTETEALGRELARARFSGLYRAYGRAITAYALRRTNDPEDAADAVSETFLVAWRRLGEVPIDGEALLWLYGAARRVLANQQRAEHRRTKLGLRLAESLRTEHATDDGPNIEAPEVLRAISRLRSEDRELLLLVSWEELSPGEAAKVLGISSLAARSRLHRARRRLRRLLEDAEGAASPGLEIDTEESR
jgi:RNA polymerase sigma-70 factor (ECF subfamily)